MATAAPMPGVTRVLRRVAELDSLGELASPGRQIRARRTTGRPPRANALLTRRFSDVYDMLATALGGAVGMPARYVCSPGH